MSYLVGVRTKEQQIEWNGGDQINEEPASEVVHRDLARVRHDLVVAVHVRRAEVYEDVNDERHVHWKAKSTVN